MLDCLSKNHWYDTTYETSTNKMCAKERPKQLIIIVQPSIHHHCADSLYLNIPLSQSKKYVSKGARISKLSYSPYLSKIKYMEERNVFIHKCIEKIINVYGNGNYGFRVVSGFNWQE